jgi:serine/threonine protein kinase
MGFNKEVALKLLRRDAAPRQRNEMEALINEARVGGRLRHPNLVENYGCEVVDGSLCITMEYVPGWTLDEVLWRCTEVEMNLPLASVIDILRQLAVGLKSAHQACDENSIPLRLIHRDRQLANHLPLPAHRWQREQLADHRPGVGRCGPLQGLDQDH